MGRDKFWDSLKFILISFVVYGHMIETYTTDNRYHQAMYFFIYIFHMPFFMFISGRFSQLTNRAKYKKGIIGILETYIVFQLIRCFKPIFWETDTILNLQILYPKGTLWYLAYLLVYRLIIYCMPVRIMKEYKFLILSFCFLLGIAWGFVPTNSFQKFFSFLPYFMLGYYSININIKKIESRMPLYLAISLAVVIWLSIYYFVNFDNVIILYCNISYHYFSPTISPISLCFSKCALYIAAITISFILMRINLKWCIFPQFGSSTLFIYMYHTFIILGLRLLITKDYIWQNEIMLIIYTICIITLLLSLSNMKIFKIIMKPITYFFYKKH